MSWHKDFSLDELTGKPLRIATSLRDFFNDKFHIKGGEVYLVPCMEHDTMTEPVVGCPACQEEHVWEGSDGGGCKLFRSPQASHGTTEYGGLLHLHYDGGIMHDYLSLDGDFNYLARSEWDAMRVSIDDILSQHGCYLEHFNGWSEGVYLL